MHEESNEISIECDIIEGVIEFSMILESPEAIPFLGCATDLSMFDFNVFSLILPINLRPLINSTNQ